MVLVATKMKPKTILKVARNFQKDTLRKKKGNKRAKREPETRPSGLIAFSIHLGNPFLKCS